MTYRSLRSAQLFMRENSLHNNKKLGFGFRYKPLKNRGECNNSLLSQHKYLVRFCHPVITEMHEQTQSDK